MSNKTQLQTNNTALDGYIARINAAKEVAAGLPEAGGGSVGTCTIKIINNIIGLGHKVSEIGYSTLNDGRISAILLNKSSSSETEIILNNVVCGSFLFINSYGYSYFGATYSGGLVDLEPGLNPWCYFMAPTENGAIGIISLEDWD